MAMEQFFTIPVAVLALIGFGAALVRGRSRRRLTITYRTGSQEQVLAIDDASDELFAVLVAVVDRDASTIESMQTDLDQPARSELIRIADELARVIKHERTNPERPLRVGRLRHRRGGEAVMAAEPEAEAGGVYPPSTFVEPPGVVKVPRDDEEESARGDKPPTPSDKQ